MIDIHSGNFKVSMEVKEYSNHDTLLVAVDCIIFGFDGQKLKALLVKRSFEPEKGKWSLMGGFINRGEGTDQAATRVLSQLTGLSNIYMEQLYCFSDVDRDMAGCEISIAYFALIKISDDYNQLLAMHDACWFSLNEIPQLIFDHEAMIDKAIKRLQDKVAKHPIGFELLPRKFTLSQLQNLYESIYKVPLDRRNFTKKILSLGVLRKLNEKEKVNSRKGAYYFVFDKATYPKLHTEGANFI